jgi:uncharacterized metal-binding protein YceD (DUF177 family)
VPEEGAQFDLSADEKTRAAIASLAGLRELPRLVGAFSVTRHGRGGLHVVGEVAATVAQTCVVTLEPVENEIRELIDLVFAPGTAQSEVDVPARGSELGTEEPPENLVDGTVDLGALATEFLILGIDPYPRKPGVVFEGASVGEAASSPFSALAKLKEKGDPQGE